jgi:hypothetical protein
VCPVCGYAGLRDPPREERTGGSYAICPSCGFQFGVSDEDLGIADEQWRQDWVKAGMPWRSVARPKPEGWNPRDQLRKITKK